MIKLESIFLLGSAGRERDKTDWGRVATGTWGMGGSGSGLVALALSASYSLPEPDLLSGDNVDLS